MIKTVLFINVQKFQFRLTDIFVSTDGSVISDRICHVKNSWELRALLCSIYPDKFILARFG